MTELEDINVLLCQLMILEEGLSRFHNEEALSEGILVQSQSVCLIFANLGGDLICLLNSWLIKLIK